MSSAQQTRLHGRGIVVTGAASGIGAAVVRQALAEGAAVAAVDIDQSALEALAGELAEFRQHLHLQVVDVRDEQQAADSVARLRRLDFPLDGLVTSAATQKRMPFLEADLAHWREVMDVNLLGAVVWARACLPAMLEKQHGSIVLLGSQLLHGRASGNASYVASKGANHALMKVLALEFALQGIRTNLLSPGATETKLLLESMQSRPDPVAAALRSKTRHAMQRWGKPQEIATAACFLLSAEAAFVSGAELLVDGGWSIA